MIRFIIAAIFIVAGIFVFAAAAFGVFKLLLVLLILWITSPVAAHQIVKAEVKTQNEDESDEYEVIGK